MSKWKESSVLAFSPKETPHKLEWPLVVFHWDIRGHPWLFNHGQRTPREEIAITAPPKIFCLPCRPNFSDFSDLCPHWVSIVCGSQSRSRASFCVESRDLPQTDTILIIVSSFPKLTHLRNDCLLNWANSQNDNYFHSKRQPRAILRKNTCHFVNLLSLASNHF